MTTIPAASRIDLDDLPGHYIRRLQQIAVAIFMQQTAEWSVTPVQFAALQTVANRPGLDQRTLARAIGFDTSTTAGVIDRLEARGLMRRGPSPGDRRVRLLTLTEAGEQLLRQVQPGMLETQKRILEPLPPADREQFVRMLRTLVDADGGSGGRVPADG